jgi:hypothetical protein
MLVFHCGGRYWITEASGQLPALSETFKTKMPLGGLNVAFEIYCGFSINNTLTSLAFGSDA